MSSSDAVFYTEQLLNQIKEIQSSFDNLVKRVEVMDKKLDEMARKNQMENTRPIYIAKRVDEVRYDC